MTSVERIVEYMNLESEAPAETQTKPEDDWPSRGQIEFDSMSFTYHRGLPDVLHHITCTIKPTEKVFSYFATLIFSVSSLYLKIFYIKQ